ncbi:Undecaprenyl-phosphate 4-deoxy-4-formamido-L-arabinose transferase [Emticicia aquatica]|uniref:Undecaprenyl-phosphate 4-deoxy-4-formamido-L-arabinose transferase n=1 Tax=Emticicia aquatica TaxID=1681835 RepID=A0ABM9ANT1_9BACT|nr:glycosyltransferase family 2 protein [Emticicia aquatica]CAH0994913.1 Undecaprenyl-phosphate 4-deoxy-4-formamido-L-arabinose transferase [Emticicia aquatica]
MDSSKLLSVVIPVYKGAKTIAKLVENLELELSDYDFEIVLVNDGSPDDSEKACLEIAKRSTKVKFYSLRKNFGEFNAVMCGLNHTEGAFVVIIDDDFQNPPSEILKLLEKSQEKNYDVVYSYYVKKKHSIFRNFGSWLVNRLTTSLLQKPADLYLSSFKLIKQEVVKEIIKYKGPYPYIDALIFRVTNNIGKTQVQHSERMEGESNYTLKRLITLFMTILFGYSLLPVRIILTLGITLVLLSILLLFLYMFNFIPDWRLSMFIFFGGIQLTSLGVIGEYISKSFLSQNQTPQYVEK